MQVKQPQGQPPWKALDAVFLEVSWVCIRKKMMNSSSLGRLLPCCGQRQLTPTCFLPFGVASLPWNHFQPPSPPPPLLSAFPNSFIQKAVLLPQPPPEHSTHSGCIITATSVCVSLNFTAQPPLEGPLPAPSLLVTWNAS